MHRHRQHQHPHERQQHHCHHQHHPQHPTSSPKLASAFCMVNFLIHCLNFSMCACHVCAMRTFWDDDAKASVARQARQVRQPGKYEDPRSLPTHLYDLLDANGAPNTPAAPNMGKIPPTMGKNAYSNYDDHCTVVVVIQYAFFKMGFWGLSSAFWLGLYSLQCANDG